MVAPGMIEPPPAAGLERTPEVGVREGGHPNGYAECHGGVVERTQCAVDLPEQVDMRGELVGVCIEAAERYKEDSSLDAEGVTAAISLATCWSCAASELPVVSNSEVTGVGRSDYRIDDPDRFTALARPSAVSATSGDPGPRPAMQTRPPAVRGRRCWHRYRFRPNVPFDGTVSALVAVPLTIEYAAGDRSGDRHRSSTTVAGLHRVGKAAAPSRARRRIRAGALPLAPAIRVREQLIGLSTAARYCALVVGALSVPTLASTAN